MTKPLQIVRAEARVSDSPLAAMLRSIGVEPIPQHTIEAYMEQELRNAPPSTALGRFMDRRGWSRYPFDDIILRTLLGICICGILEIALSGVAWVFGWWSSDTESTMAVVALSTITGAAFWCLGKHAHFVITFARGEARWVLLSDAGFYLPPFIHDRMCLVERFFPGARFEIADLRQNCYSLDPVLFVVLDGEREAICAWKNLNEEIRLV